jgi:hypothetical protein
MCPSTSYGWNGPCIRPLPKQERACDGALTSTMHTTAARMCPRIMLFLRVPAIKHLQHQNHCYQRWLPVARTLGSVGSAAYFSHVMELGCSLAIRMHCHA